MGHFQAGMQATEIIILLQMYTQLIGHWAWTLTLPPHMKLLVFYILSSLHSLTFLLQNMSEFSVIERIFLPLYFQTVL